MYKFIIPLSLALMAGSAFAGEADYGFIASALASTEKISTKAEAQEAIQAIRDTTLFPGPNLADVTVSDLSLTLKFVSAHRHGKELGGFSDNLLFDKDFAPVAADPEQKESSSLVRTLWFRDITGIQLTRMAVYDDSQHKVKGDYRCLLVLKEGKAWEIFSTSANAASRLAEAIKFLSSAEILGGQPLAAGCQCVIDDKNPVVIGLQAGGLFDKSGFKLFETLVSLDGSASNLKSRLEGLASGKHEISYFPLGTYYNKKVDNSVRVQLDLP
jgi:hypothetical protein